MNQATRSSRVFAGLPPHGAGQRIGLYGGSFNPPHEGHRQTSLKALYRLKLDAVWWLVTPGNPLKEAQGLKPLSERMRAAAELAAHPRFFITGIEARWRLRYTADFLTRLTARLPATRFVWIMGSDNLQGFHRWEDWNEIAATVPIAVVPRPQSLTALLSSRAAVALRRYRLPTIFAPLLADCVPPAYIVLDGPRTGASSTALRIGAE
ncbi:nicotinate-nucleotide adenylyltransferase [Afifella pfennigii]|uniref:nicotinate-nucleotide adenylyltransferase n=1 Tax=Afifella pfennigii TaxID=209897 RepID=UPI00068A3444|nr:nicotinate-nucleotide adenylyltransferase [Afifella pfennigii]